MTQRRPNPYFLRASATSAQAMHPMADFAAKGTETQARRSRISEDFAFGHEQMGGFQQNLRGQRRQDPQEALAAAGRPRTTRPMSRRSAMCDGVCQGFAGSNPLRFMKAYDSRRA